MKKQLIVLIASLLLCPGCATEPARSTDFFIVKVDSISHTPYGATGDTLVIRLYGTIGTDGCYSFARFDAVKTPLQVDLTVVGQHSSSGACPAVMVYLGGKPYKWTVTQQGWFVVNIHQPDKTILKDSILIK